jgi:cysteinyl-tRNA synthetase
VLYVENVTDIDDRSIATAKELGVTYRDVVDRNFAEFKTAMSRLDVLEPDVEPRATEYVPQIQAMIRELIDRQHAYSAEDGIYYAVQSFPAYGALSNRKIDELEAGARIEIGEHKRDPLDFALWKFAKPGEPSWPFEPFGAGRPGWHIECSAMSRNLLDREGAGFDIHGGGADLIFPHHENEIAQSEPLMRKPPMATFWVHGGLLLFDSRKMSKSLGNFEPLIDVLARHDPQAIRLLFLQTGYRKVMNFTEDSIDAAATVLARVKRAYRALANAAGASVADPGDDELVLRVEAALEDDMNTAVALSELVRVAGNVDRALQPASAARMLRDYDRALRLLGIEPKDSWLGEAEVTLPGDFVASLQRALGDELSLDGAGAEDAIARVIVWRTEARKRKDWAASDRLRDALAACGVALHDTKDGTTWTVST